MSTQQRASAPDLRTLVLDGKGDRSFDRVSSDCGGVPTGKRLQQIATTPLKTFPDPASIRGLARGLGVSQQDVILASARSLGLSVAGDHTKGALVLSDIDELDGDSRQVLTSLARTLVRLSRDRSIVDASVSVLTGESDDVRREAARTLGRLDPEFSRDLSSALSEVAKRAREGDGRVRVVDVLEELAREQSVLEAKRARIVGDTDPSAVTVKELTDGTATTRAEVSSADDDEQSRPSPTRADYAKAAQKTGPKTSANRARRREEKNRIPGEHQGEALEGEA